jgi:ankyrin repeat protein
VVLQALLLLFVVGCRGESPRAQPTPVDPRKELDRLRLPYDAATFAGQAQRGNEETVKLFLDAGIDPNAQVAEGRTALMAASAAGRVDVVRTLLDKGAQADLQDRALSTALMLAIKARQAGVVDLLLEKGANLWLQDERWSPVMLAAFVGDRAIVKALLAKEAAVNDANLRGMTPLMYAAGRGHTDIVQALIAGGANVNARDVAGHTALMFAADNGRTETVKALAAAGADASARNRNGQTALAYAVVNGHREAADLLRPLTSPAKPPSRRPPTPPPAAPPPRPGDDAAVLDDAARVAWSFAQAHYQPSTGLVGAVGRYPYATVWDIGSSLAVFYCAHELKLLGDAEYDHRLRRVLATLRKIPLFDGVSFNKSYNTRTGAMASHGGLPSKRGAGWSTTDLGRMLVWLKIVAQQPGYADDAAAIVKRVDAAKLIRDGYLRGATVDPRGLREYQEGRVGYEQYAAQGFAVWGLIAERALRFEENAIPITVMGKSLLADFRGEDRYTSEPLILMGLELGWTPEAERLARELLAAQEERYRLTGRVTVVSEDAIGRPPHFFYYYCAYANGKEFGLDVQDIRAAVDAPRWVSTKAAFAWHALLPSDYTRRALATVARSRAAGGWGSGVYEDDGRSTGTANINTQAVVLEAALVKRTGRPLLAPAARPPARIMGSGR